MKKKYQLKEWLTIEDARECVSEFLEEELSAADVFHLALDYKLVMSIRISGSIDARRGAVVNYTASEVASFLEGADSPPDLKIVEVPSFMAKQRLPDGRQATHEIRRMLLSMNMGNDQWLTLDDAVVRIGGIWDLAMFGAERIWVEDQYRSLIGLDPMDLINIEGSFVKRSEKEIFKLVESYEWNPDIKGSLAELDRIKQTIPGSGNHALKAAIDRHKEDRVKFLKRKEEEPDVDNYYPRTEMPENCEFVIRPENIYEFENWFAKRKEKFNVPYKEEIQPKHDTRYLQLLRAASQRFWELYDPADPSTAPTNDSIQSWLITQGVSKNIAAVMATILRADGLKTGRR